MTTPTFRRGAEEAAAASKSAQFAKTHFFSIEDGKSEIVRFITDLDEWIVVDQHGNVPTRERPTDLDKDSNWPGTMGAVCRRDRAFGDMFPDCYICDEVRKADGKPNRPSGRSWGIGVLREAVKQDGKIVGYRDKKREVAVIGADGKPTGETTSEKEIVIFNMGFKNFLAPLKGYGEHYGTILDRDYLIKRVGKELATTYNIIALDPIPGFDLRDDETKAKYADHGIDLAAEVTQRASDDFYDRFFDKRHPQPSNKKADAASGDAAPAAEQSKPSTEMDEADLAALAARVKGAPAPNGAEPVSDAAPAASDPAPAASAPAGIQNFND